jgi:hypothetical protein
LSVDGVFVNFCVFNGVDNHSFIQSVHQIRNLYASIIFFPDVKRRRFRRAKAGRVGALQRDFETINLRVDQVEQIGIFDILPSCPCWDVDSHLLGGFSTQCFSPAPN